MKQLVELYIQCCYHVTDKCASDIGSLKKLQVLELYECANMTENTLKYRKAIDHPLRLLSQSSALASPTQRMIDCFSMHHSSVYI